MDVLINGEQYHIVGESSSEYAYNEISKQKKGQSLKLSGLKESDYDTLSDWTTEDLLNTVAYIHNKFVKSEAVQNYVETEDSIHVDGNKYFPPIEPTKEQKQKLRDEIIKHIVHSEKEYFYIDGLINTFNSNLRAGIECNEMYYDMMVTLHDSWIIYNIDKISEPDMQDKLYKFAPVEGMPFKELENEGKALTAFEKMANSYTNVYQTGCYINSLEEISEKEKKEIIWQNQKAYKQSSKDQIVSGLNDYYQELGIADKVPDQLITKIAEQSLEKLREEKVHSQNKSGSEIGDN